MKKKLNAALIGCGRISKNHIHALIDNNDILNLLAVSDIKPEKAIQAKALYIKSSKKHPINSKYPLVCNDYQQVLHNNLVDIIIIATESGKHYQIAMDAMAKNKHVLVEKPMALNIEHALEMIQLSEKNQVQLGVCHQNRFNPSIQHLKKAIDGGRFGKIFAGSIRVLWNRNKQYYEEASWRGTYEQDGGCLMNQCIHGIDALLWMIGAKPERINGIVKNFLHPYIEVEDYGLIQVLFENGVIGAIEGTVNIFDKNLNETISIFGENGSAIVGGSAMNKIEHWNFLDGTDSLEGIRLKCNQEISDVYGRGHTPLYKNFVNAVNGTERLLVNGYEGKKAVALIKNVYDSNV